MSTAVKLDKNERILMEMRRALEDAARWRKFRNVVGYVENGSDASVTLFQDDATKSWHLRVNNSTYSRKEFHGTLDEVLNEAFKHYVGDEEDAL